MKNPIESEWSIKETAHLLNRAGFSESITNLQSWHEIGKKAAIEQLLNAPLDPAVNLPKHLEINPLRDFETRARNELLLTTKAQPEYIEIKKKMGEHQRRTLAAINRWWFNCMLHSKTPLHEKMTLFWHDHFAIIAKKSKISSLLIQHHALLRSHAIGNFKDLVHEMLFDGAMAIFLDLRNSVKENPNENFAREILELFTLEEGNYDEKDILELARCFTGYKLNLDTGKVEYVQKKADTGKKTIFGETGNWNGTEAIEIIFKQAACAEFIVAKLWNYFVENEADPETLKQLAAQLREDQFNIKNVLKMIFSDHAFYSETIMFNQIKSPLQYLVQLLKQLNITDPHPDLALYGQKLLGQTLFMPPNVAGWNWGKAWINTDSILQRYNIAGYLCDPENVKKFKIQGSKRGDKRVPTNVNWEFVLPEAFRSDPNTIVNYIEDSIFYRSIPQKYREIFLQYLTQNPIKNDKDIAGFYHLVFSTPLYQLM